MSAPTVLIIASPGIGYPAGFAPTGRIRAYARGLVGTGFGVEVLCPAPSEGGSSHLNDRVAGEAEGVRFEYTCGRVDRPDAFLARQWLKARGFARAVARVVMLGRGGSLHAVLLYTDSPWRLPFYWAACRLAGCALLVDKSELPEVHLGRLFAATLGRFYVRHAFKWVDGVIVINRHLELLMKGLTGCDEGVLYVPVMIDSDEIRNAQPHETERAYVAYCGRLGEHKDGVESLLVAFAEAAQDVPELDLMIVGDNSPVSGIPEYLDRASALGIAERVRFMGTVSRAELLSLMKGSTALLLARPDNDQTRYNFPTKLAEYLSTGRPVVVTDVGEVADLIGDGAAFLCPAADPSAFAAMIVGAVRDVERAEGIAAQGQRTAIATFDYRPNALRIKAFIDEQYRRRAHRYGSDST